MNTFVQKNWKNVSKGCPELQGLHRIETGRCDYLNYRRLYLTV